MKQMTSNRIKLIARESLRFFAPERIMNTHFEAKVSNKTQAVVIPTYIPTITTYNLIQSIIKYNPDAFIVVVDDCTPATEQNIKILEKITILAAVTKNLTFIRTPKNTLKAGALNYGIKFLMNLKNVPDVIFTFDDDVKIDENTISRMVATLYSGDSIGAVCSEVRVINKNANILTRLQALEYHNFNITKISDNGFLKGPLVMQGMLSAYRTTAMKQVKGFTQGHLIEDYDITARLKSKGWKVKLSQDALAWTYVPETLEALWKQRVRWINGGLIVLSQFYKNASVVYQDLLGHILFLSLFLLIAASFLFVRTADGNNEIPFGLFLLSLLNFFIAFIFNIVSLAIFKDADKRDWLLKFSIVPELVYSNILSAILLGSYFFFLYNKIAVPAVKKIALLQKPYNWGLTAFNKAGFNATWGTR